MSRNLRALDTVTVAAFQDELELIKEAGFMQNVGNAITHSGKWLGRQAVETAENLGKTGKGFLNPIQATKQGWNWSVRDFGTAPRWAQAMTLAAIPLTALQVRDSLKREDPTGMRRSRLERVGDTVGSTVGGLIGTPHGISGGLAGAVVGGKIVGTAGKVMHRAIYGRQPQQPAQPPQAVQQVPQMPEPQRTQG